MQEIPLKIRYFERRLTKTFKKVNFFFLSNPITFNGHNYQKQKGPGTSDQSVFRLKNKFKKISLLVIYYLTRFEGIIWRGFWVIPKITSSNLCKPMHDIINYSTSICPFESGKSGKENEKIHKFEYPENERSFLVEICSLWRTIIWWKQKNLITNRRLKFYECWEKVYG